MTRRLDPATRAAGDRFIAEWQGACFTWNGRSREDGTDCWGLAVAFAREVLSLELIDWQRADHSRRWVVDVMARESATLERYEDPREGCLALVTQAGRVHHVGIVWRGGIFHAAEGRGVIWERLCEFVRAHPQFEFAEMAP